MTKALALILALSATGAHAALEQGKPDTEAQDKPITVYERPVGCSDNERPKRFMKMEVKKLINDRLVVAYVAISPVC